MSERGGTDGESVLAREAAERAAVSDAALARHAHRVRRQRLLTYPVVGALVLALVVVFTVAYLHGEAHNTRSISVADAPGPVALQTPAAEQRVLWRSPDTAALGSPHYSGTVVVHDAHTVRGLNARTGKQTWSYYRSNRTVCAAMQLNGIAVAVYELAGNCDELTGLDAGTGALQWTRTLDFDGQPLFGHPTYQVDTFDSTLMITSPTVIYAIGVGSGLNGDEDHFIYSHVGCRINGAALGPSGALISQTCTRPRCGTLKFCGKGTQLLLRGNLYTDVDTEHHPNNPNFIAWNDFGNTDIPVAAGTGLVAAGNRTTGDLDILAPKTGKPAGSVAFGATGRGWTDSSVTTLSGRDTLVWTPSTMASIGTSTATWKAGSLAAPSVSADTVTQVTASGVRLLAASSGAVQHRYPLSPEPPRDSTVYRLGAGFLVASRTGTVAYG